MKALPANDVRPTDTPAPDSTAKKMGGIQPALKSIATTSLVGVVVVAFAVLVTAIFSFVGTISCCVLSGMMLGSIRCSKWHAILTSALFPLVMFALLQFSAPAVSLQKAVGLASLCFAIFWAIYFLTRLLMLLEAKPSAEPSHDPAAQAGHGVSHAGESVVKGISPGPGSPSASSGGDQPLEPGIAALQGRWIRLPEEGEPLAQIIEFTRETFKIQRMDREGNLLLCSEGTAECEALGPFMTIKIGRMTARSSAHTGECRDEVQTWIYSVASGELTIASHFDGRSGGRPIAERYRKVADGSRLSCDPPVPG